MTDAALVPWRVGRKLGRTIYAKDGTDEGTYLGMMETVGLAEQIVQVHNLLIMSEFTVEYGHMVTPNGRPEAVPLWINEPRGSFYAMFRRGVYRQPPEPIWSSNESAPT